MSTSDLLERPEADNAKGASRLPSNLEAEAAFLAALELRPGGRRVACHLGSEPP